MTDPRSLLLMTGAGGFGSVGAGVLGAGWLCSAGFAGALWASATLGVLVTAINTLMSAIIAGGLQKGPMRLDATTDRRVIFFTWS
ncbi:MULTISPECIES: hypothetical protein [Pacificibacter]|uniref:hypothetical protein n=1 Tax=Pacificibacter TaxID=1042323 RepID=UPI002090040F|nr:MULTISPECIES: hypothetical protein [Pacificibacter]MDO6616152.1 hypothetical protein [Pacificibacter sp. 1_MG-2023]